MSDELVRATTSLCSTCKSSIDATSGAAKAAAFFVSDKNSYMSGATVVIDGAV
ncbi:hypothetical protein [Massilia violaceinigra]|uniref:hypothetical protein n=1 Tax=Massilia violaceinigra TaxID=2045208 RepID=UPI0012FE00A8|nr:hypothetical protein [Massilia violaceinigra]